MDRERPEELKFHTYLWHVEEETDLEALRRQDCNIASDIARAKSMIQQMENYRKEIFEQAQRIAAAPVTLELELIRSHRYVSSGQYRPFYYLTRYEVYAGIGKKKIQQEVFPGKERFKAIKLLDEWKKQHPYATVTVNIQKSKWER